MAYTLLDLKTTVKKRAKDTSFDDTLLTDYIQEAQNQVLEHYRFPFMEVSDTDTASIGSFELELYNDVEVILSLKLVYETTDAKFEPIYLGYSEFYDRFDPDTEATSSSPVYFTVFNNTIIWGAPLDKTYKVYVKYLKTPKVFTADTDVPSIPKRFKEIIIRGALARVEEYRDNYDKAAIHFRKVEDLSEDMVNRLSLRQLKQPHKISFGGR